MFRQRRRLIATTTLGLLMSLAMTSSAFASAVPFEAEWTTIDATAPVSEITSDGIVHQRGSTITLEMTGDLSGIVTVTIDVNPPTFRGTFVMTTAEAVFSGSLQGDFRVGPGNRGTLVGTSDDGAVIRGEFAEIASWSGIYVFTGSIITR